MPGIWSGPPSVAVMLNEVVSGLVRTDVNEYGVAFRNGAVPENVSCVR